MTRRLWVLFGWSPRCGAAVAVVAVLGLEGSAMEIAWMPLEYEAAEIWRRRLATTTHDLEAQLRHWERSMTAPAVPVPEPPLEIGGALTPGCSTKRSRMLRPTVGTARTVRSS